jgi:F0F1-type ATP synthase assembly protein I
MPIYLRKRGPVGFDGALKPPIYCAAMIGGPQRGNAWSGMGIGWGITSTMIAGILVWGGLGYLLDRLAGTTHAFTTIGIVLGAGGATYIVYLRYGREDRGHS